MSDFYPRWKCKLIVYLEDLGKKVYDGKAPPKETNKLKGKSDNRAPLERVQDPLAPPGVRRFILLPKGMGTAKAGGPQDQILDESMAYTLEGIVPHEFNLSRNGIRMADTFSMSIRFIELPIDPRLVRSVGIKFYLGTVSSEEHAEGLSESRIKGIESTGMIPDGFVDEDGVHRSNERFSGFGDKWTINWSENGEPIVQIEGRDNTQLFIDQECPADLVLDVNKPIDESIGDYIANFPQMYGMSIEYRGPNIPLGERTSDDKPPSLEGVLSKTAYRPELGPQPAKGGGGGEKIKVWDFLTDVVSSIGHNIRVEGNLVIVQRTKSLYSAKPGFTSRGDDPFKGRDGSAYRRWFYGHNILSMQTSRLFTRTPQNIEVRCYSPKRKKVLVARFPPTDEKNVQPKGGGAESTYRVWKLSGISDEKTLQIAAQNIYEMQGRNELEVQLKTKNLASFGGGNLDPDVLDMQAGDGFEVFINSDEDRHASTATKVEEAIVNRGSKFLQDLGFPQEFAQAYSRLYVDAGFQTVFKTKTLSLTGNLDEGVNLELVGMNYIEVRADKFIKGVDAEAGGTAPEDNPKIAPKPSPNKPLPPPKNPGPPPDAPAPVGPLAPAASSTPEPLFTSVKGGSSS